MTLRMSNKLIHLNIFFIYIASAVVSVGHAQGLIDIYALAKARDSQVLEAEANFKAALQSSPIARAALLPQVSMTLESNDTSLDTEGITFGVGSASVDYNTHGYSVRVTQALYNQSFILQLRQARNTVARAKVEYDAAKQDLIIRTSEAYFNVLAAQDNLSFATAEKEAIKRQLEQAEKRFEVGLIPITDVKEAQASYDLSVAREIDAEIQLELSNDALAVITGERLDSFSDLSNRIQLVRPEPTNVDEWIHTAHDNNLSILISEYDTRISQQEIRLNRAQHIPTLDFIATYGDSDTGGITGTRQVDDSLVGVELTVPIFSGGRVYYQTKESKHLYQAAVEAQERVRRETTRDTRDAFHNVVAGISRVKAFQRAVESAQIAADATEAGFEVGTRTSVDVLLALRTVFESQRDLAQARYDYILDTLNLKQAAGSLNPDDLLQINAWLE